MRSNWYLIYILRQYLVFVSPGHAVEVVVESFLPMELVEGEAGGELTLI